MAAAHAALRLYRPREARLSLAAAAKDQRGWEWRYLERNVDRSERVFRPPGNIVSWVACHGDDILASSANQEGQWVTAHARTTRVLATDIPTTTVTLGPKGERLLFGLHDGTIRIVDGFAFDAAIERKAHERQVKGIAVRADGGRFVSFAWDNHACLWTFDGEEPVAREKGRFSAVAFGAREVALGDRGGAVTWRDGESFEMLRRKPAHAGAVTAMAVSGGQWATAGADQVVRVWNAKGEVVHHLRQRAETATALVFDGTRLAAGFADGTVTVWDAASGRMLTTLWGHERSVRSIAVRPDRSLVTSAEDGTVRTWRVVDPSTAGPALRCLAYAPDGKRVATGGFGGHVRVHDARDGVELARRLVHNEKPARLQAVAFSPDGKRIACGGSGGFLKVLDADTLETLKETTADDTVLALAYLPNGDLVVGGAGTTVRDPATLEVKRQFDSGAWTYGLGVLDGGRAVIAAGDKHVGCWDVASGRLLWRTPLTGDGVAAVAVRPDGAEFALAYHSSPPELWDARTGERRFVLPGARGWAAAYAPDGTRLAVADFRTIRVFDPTTRAIMIDLPTAGGEVYGLSFSPDGQYLAATDDRGRLALR